MTPNLTTLAVHPGALGDVVIFARLLEAIGGNFTLVTDAGKGRLLSGLGVVQRALDFDAVPMHEVFSDQPLESCRLAGLLGEHDRLLSCFGDGHALAQQRLAAVCRCQDAAFLPVRPPESFAGHLLELWCDMLGVSCDLACLRAWALPRAWQDAAGQVLAEAGIEPDRPYAVIHPGAGSAVKCWALERFMELAATLPSAGASCQVVFVAGPVEADLWRSKGLDKLRREFHVVQSPPLETLAGILAGCEAYVGNDSGASHLSAAVGARTVALFGPTRSEHFRPVGPDVHVIQARRLIDISCSQVLAALDMPG